MARTLILSTLPGQGVVQHLLSPLCVATKWPLSLPSYPDPQLWTIFNYILIKAFISYTLFDVIKLLTDPTAFLFMCFINCVRIELRLEPSSKPARFLRRGMHSYTYQGPDRFCKSVLFYVEREQELSGYDDGGWG